MNDDTTASATAREEIATERLCEAEDALMLVVSSILCVHNGSGRAYGELANCISHALTDYFARPEVNERKCHSREALRDALGDEWLNYLAAVAYDCEVQAALDDEAGR